jgi:transcription elongation factor GreA
LERREAWSALRTPTERVTVVDRHQNSSSPALLTAHGRRLLDERRRLLVQRLDELRQALVDRDRPADIVEEHFRLGHELDAITSVLTEALTADDMPADPRLVELGDTVTIRLEDGMDERYIIVHPLEATVDDARISADSPLGCTLLQRQVGESIEVAAPAGSYRCTIMSATRASQGPGTSVRASS